MVITVVLRLLPGPLESGDLVGHVEHVSTGVMESVRGPAELVAFCRQALDEPTCSSPALPAEGPAWSVDPTVE